MRLTGFGDFSWEASGYWAGIPDDFIPVVSVEPLILPRPGAYAAFGISTVGQMQIPCDVGYRGALTFEAAWLNFFKRLNPVDTAPRQLRAVRNDNTAISILAVLQIPNYGDGELNSRRINFITVQPFWLASGYTTGTGGFS